MSVVQPALDWSALVLAGAIVVTAYLVGSVSPSYMFVRRALGADIRQLGDGNAGAENVSRVLGLKPAILVGAFDLFKGLLVVLAARGLSPTPADDGMVGYSLAGDGFRNTMMLSAGAAAVIGHSWSIYLKGTGGRGAATAAGAMIVLVPLPALLMALPSLGLMFLYRSTTWGLASFFIGCVGMVGVLGYFGMLGYTWPWVAYAAALPALVGVIHYRSLRRPLARAAGANEE